MSGFRRPKPDPVALSHWLEGQCRASPGWQAYARALWLAWAGFAEAEGVEAGTPRSFSNALRGRGFPVSRPFARYPRARFHVGVRLHPRPDDEDLGLGWRAIRLEKITCHERALALRSHILSA